jgi:hypothetical protein
LHTLWYTTPVIDFFFYNFLLHRIVPYPHSSSDLGYQSMSFLLFGFRERNTSLYSLYDCHTNILYYYFDYFVMMVYYCYFFDIFHCTSHRYLYLNSLRYY